MSGVGMKAGDQVVRFRNCLKCEGRGYFLIDAFIVDWSQLLMPSNLTQRPDCVAAHAFWQEHKRLPNPGELDTAALAKITEGAG